VAKALREEGVWGWGLSEPFEAQVLRKAGFNEPILLLSGFEKFWIEAIDELDITPVITSFDELNWLKEFAKKRERTFSVHIKVDTGMHRFGFSIGSIPQLLRELKSTPMLKVEGLMTHLASSEEPCSDLTIKQLKNFSKVLEEFKKQGFSPKYLHFANTGGIMFLEDKGNLVRPGIGLFGGYPSKTARKLVKLQPVMTLVSKLVEVKEVKPGDLVGYGGTYEVKKRGLIGIVPVGYGDGYLRALSNKGFAWIKGKRVRVVGRVSMKCLYLDISEVEGVKKGEQVVLLGGENEEVPADELAERAGTISYELFCSFGKNLPKEYVGC